MNHVDSKTSKRIVLFLLMLLLVLDSALVLLSMYHYYFLFHTSTGWLIPILFNILILILIMFISKKWILSIPIFLLTVCILVYGVGMLFLNWDSDYVDSPRETETLIIKHRVATLGESNYFFEFYQKSHIILMKKLNNQELKIMVSYQERDPYPNAQKALGFDRAEWLTEKKILFESKDGPKVIELN